MYKLVLMRHGESQWNLENRFTGWTDVDLSDQGRQEAAQAGRELLATGIRGDVIIPAYRLLPPVVLDPLRPVPQGERS